MQIVRIITKTIYTLKGVTIYIVLFVNGNL
jgi:hypothetical protein